MGDVPQRRQYRNTVSLGQGCSSKSIVVDINTIS